MNIDRCALTYYDLKPEQIQPLEGLTIKYETEFVGKVHITLAAYQELLNSNEFPHEILAGICKNRTLNNEEPVLIDSDFIRNGYKKLSPPLEFEEKCYHFLKYLYINGGKENKDFEIHAGRMYPISYGTMEEFSRIMNQLASDRYITIGKSQNISARTPGHKYYWGVKVTRLGKNEAEKTLPKMPLIGLVSQEITTGDYATDAKINYARVEFFEEPRTMEKMRSACETLCHVLEPLRDSLSSAFTQKDVSDFFQLVNTFDIRHNKDTTKNLVHEEQLEWIFYTLLNSINTYTKLKNSGKI